MPKRRTGRDVQISIAPDGSTTTAVEYGRKKKRQLAPLWWHGPTGFKPLRIAFVNDELTDYRIRAATYFAIHYLERFVGHELFHFVTGPSGVVQVSIQGAKFEDQIDWDQFSAPKPGFLLGGGTAIAPMSPVSEQEMGYCELWFNDATGQVQSSCIGVDHDLDWGTLWAIVAHELVHALLIGHDPDTPARLMHKHHGGHREPRHILMPIEARWICEIHGLDWVPLNKRGNR